MSKENEINTEEDAKAMAMKWVEMEAECAADLAERIIKQHPKAIQVKPLVLNLCKLLASQENRLISLEEELARTAQHKQPEGKPSGFKQMS